MDLRDLATRLATTNIEARRKKNKNADKPTKKPRRVTKTKTDLLTPKTEYSAHIGLSITVDFEGDVSKEALEKKIQSELIAAIQNGMTVVADEFNLQSTVARVKPVEMSLAVNDQADVEEEFDTETTEEDTEDTEEE